MRPDRIASLPRDRVAGSRTGVASICTAHPLVIETALRHGMAAGSDVLIEATCNQVNQDGGYTGMTPTAYRRFVEDIADRVGFDRDRLILGGDHLGPNPWRHLPADEAMARAEAMIASYARAGFTKLHLDASMGCAGEPGALEDATVAQRAARLAVAAEGAAEGRLPSYVIGTEVPVPGGAPHGLDHLEVTLPEDAVRTVEIHRAAFAAAGAGRAFDRVVGLVVQPGVEFGNTDVIGYDRGKARRLSETLGLMPQLVFEAHSTDYQQPGALAALVEDGFAILKVGPWLTFAYREALYGLDNIARTLDPSFEGLADAMERLMLAEPQNWHRYYHGDGPELRVQRHFSYSDRIRYFWPHKEAVGAVARLMEALGDRRLPDTLVSQHLAASYPAVSAGLLVPTAAHLVTAAVRRVLDVYGAACGGAAAAMTGAGSHG